MQPATFHKCNLQPVTELSERLQHKLQICSGAIFIEDLPVIASAILHWYG